MIADVAGVLATPIPYLLEMDWDEVLLWHDEALRLHKARSPQM